jgi:hypothetical protein
MRRASATFRQSDLDRAIRAAKKAGASEVILRCGDQEVIVKLSPLSTSPENAVADDSEVVL